MIYIMYQNKNMAINYSWLEKTYLYNILIYGMPKWLIKFLSNSRLKMSNYRDDFLENNYYLVFNQWFNHNILFENNDDYKTFILYVISNILDHSGIMISAYSILPDRFYLVIKNNEKWLKLSDFMRKIQVSYAMYSKKKDEEGSKSRWLPVFEWRFKAKVIDIEDLEKVESCVAFEPIRAKLVENINNRPYTSAHQVIDTGYDYKSQTHIKIYNDWRKIQKMFFEDDELNN